MPQVTAPARDRLFTSHSVPGAVVVCSLRSRRGSRRRCCMDRRVRLQAAQDRDFGRADLDVDLLSGYRCRAAQPCEQAGTDRFGAYSKLRSCAASATGSFRCGADLGLELRAVSAGAFDGGGPSTAGDFARGLGALSRCRTETHPARFGEGFSSCRTADFAPLCGFIAATLAVSMGNRRLLTRYGVSDDKIFFAPYAVDHARFRLPTVGGTRCGAPCGSNLGLWGSSGAAVFESAAASAVGLSTAPAVGESMRRCGCVATVRCVTRLCRTWRAGRFPMQFWAFATSASCRSLCRSRCAGRSVSARSVCDGRAEAIRRSAGDRL